MDGVKIVLVNCQGKSKQRKYLWFLSTKALCSSEDINFTQSQENYNENLDTKAI